MKKISSVIFSTVIAVVVSGNASSNEMTSTGVITSDKSSWAPPSTDKAVAENQAKSSEKYKAFKTISVEVIDKVATLTINHPPINLFDLKLIIEMNSAAGQLAKDDDVNVVVIQSADPKFFIAHADVNLLLARGRTTPSANEPESFFHAMTEQFRLMPKATIGKLDGIARGGGLELLAALDMRFCSIENTVVGQPEIALGLIPGGGGSSRWPRIMGTARALELNLSGLAFDCTLAERYGMVNRGMPADELDGFVDTLASRIASYSPASVQNIKNIAYDERPIKEVLRTEAKAITASARSKFTLEAMQEFVDNDSQSRANELRAISAE